MQKYVKLTYNGGRILRLKWEVYLKNEKYWHDQECQKEIYFEKV